MRRFRSGSQGEKDFPRRNPGDRSLIFLSLSVEESDWLPLPQPENPADVSDLQRVIDHGLPPLNLFGIDPETPVFHLFIMPVKDIWNSLSLQGPEGEARDKEVLYLLPFALCSQPLFLLPKSQADPSLSLF